MVHVGRDYVVLAKPEALSVVRDAPDTWGPSYAQSLPPAVRKGLDPRGLLACLEDRKAFEAATYAEVPAHVATVWLPVRKPRKPRMQRLLLIALSKAREELLLGEPALVSDIVRERGKVAIPGSIELDEVWLDLQRALLEFAGAKAAAKTSVEALTAHSGSMLYDDFTIDAATLVAPEPARAAAEWIVGLPSDLAAWALRQETSGSRKGPKTLSERLGAAGAPDPAAPKEGAARAEQAYRASERELSVALEKVRAFCAELLKTRRAYLAIRFRD